MHIDIKACCNDIYSHLKSSISTALWHTVYTCPYSLRPEHCRCWAHSRQWGHSARLAFGGRDFCHTEERKQCSPQPAKGQVRAQWSGVQGSNMKRLVCLWESDEGGHWASCNAREKVTTVKAPHGQNNVLCSVSCFHAEHTRTIFILPPNIPLILLSQNSLFCLSF